MRLTGAALVVAMIVACGFVCPRASGQSQPPQPAAESPSLGTITPYLGVPVTEIELSGVPAEDATALLAATPLKLGEPLTRQLLHDTMQALFATGRFADIQAEAEHSTAGVRLRFLTVPNYFIGQVSADGVTGSPSPNQLVTASRLQLGELYSQDKLDKALANLQRVLEENGFHRSKVSTSVAAPRRTASDRSHLSRRCGTARRGRTNHAGGRRGLLGGCDRGDGEVSSRSRRCGDPSHARFATDSSPLSKAGSSSRTGASSRPYLSS